MDNLIVLIGTALSSSAITALITSFFARKKVNAEAADVAMSGTVKWAESMRIDIQRLTDDMDDLRLKYEEVLKENYQLKERILHLESELSKYQKV